MSVRPMPCVLADEPETTPTPQHGIKHDAGKPTITLLPWREFEKVHHSYNEATVLEGVEWSMSYQLTRAMHVDDADQWGLLGAAIVERDDRNLLAHAFDVEAVLQHGAKKYAPDNWKLVLAEPGGVERYKQACLRHIKAMYDGERTDPDSGLPHAAHALCCVLFILYAKAEEVTP